MKKPILLGALAVLLALGGQAFAVIGTIDDVPAATLLIPYFAVDVSDDACADPTAGVTTLFSVNNASADSAVAHVTIWTDWSVPSLDFDIFLTGYDVQTVNLRDIFCNGNLPQTGLGSGNSNVGLFSTGTPDFLPSCNQSNVPGDGPFYNNPFSQLLIDQLQTWHTGQAGAGTGDCAGSDQGDEIARGYITIDNVNQCSLLFPSSPGYFNADPMVSIASQENVLWGDFFIADPANDFSQGFSAVHIEAGSQGPHTFYGRYSIPNEGGPVDAREPLPTVVAGRYVNGGGFDNTTHLVWREGGSQTSAVTCGLRPAWFPLGFTGEVVVFDEEENPFVPTPQTGPSNPLPPELIALNLPNETNELLVGTTTGTDVTPLLDIGTFDFGWVYYNLQSAATQPVYGDDFAQGWLSIAIKALGRFSVGLHGVQLDNANAPITVDPGPPAP